MKETVYFGTYTRRLSKGIYKADFDTILSFLLLNQVRPILPLTKTNIYIQLVVKMVKGGLRLIKRMEL